MLRAAAQQTSLPNRLIPACLQRLMPAGCSQTTERQHCTPPRSTAAAEGDWRGLTVRDVFQFPPLFSSEKIRIIEGKVHWKNLVKNTFFFFSAISSQSSFYPNSMNGSYPARPHPARPHPGRSSQPPATEFSVSVDFFHMQETHLFQTHEAG